MGPLADSMGVTLNNSITDDAVWIYGDVLRLKQVLINLLTNSVKFTPRAGTVSLEYKETDDGGGQISVTDTGVGMSSEDIDKAMEKFGRISHEIESGIQGTGLGLPLSSGLMALHDGLLNIDSKPGAGTTIRLRLPKERMRSNPVAPTA